MKRFWSEVHVVPEAGGHALRLDTRPVRTPARAPLVLPTRPLAEAVAGEWAAQGAEIAPLTMPLTRAANAAIDRVVPERAAVAAVVAGYGESDLTCYRAPDPDGLVHRQAGAWDPLIDWAAERFGARLVLAEGIMHVAQPPEALARLSEAVEAHDAWTLTALHDLVTLSGSLLIGLAVSEAALEPAEGWRRSRIDEDWNIAQWGEDAEAAARAEARRREFLVAARLLSLLRGGAEG